MNFSRGWIIISGLRLLQSLLATFPRRLGISSIGYAGFEAAVHLQKHSLNTVVAFLPSFEHARTQSRYSSEHLHNFVHFLADATAASQVYFSEVVLHESFPSELLRQACIAREGIRCNLLEGLCFGGASKLGYGRVSDADFLHTLLKQSMEGWLQWGRGGIRAEWTKVTLSLQQAEESALVEKLILRAGHFCNRQLEIGWAADSNIAISTLDWLKVRWVVLITLNVNKFTDIQVVVSIQREAIGEMCEQTLVQNTPKMVQVGREDAERLYGARDWERHEWGGEHFRPNITTWFRLASNGIAVQLFSGSARSSATFSTS